MNNKIIFLAPDKKLAMLAQRVINRLGEPIDVYCGSLSEGLSLAEAAVKDGARLIISRGATGELIETNLKVPVIYLETSSYDIIQAINKAMKTSKRIAIVGFANLIKSYEKVVGILEDAFSARMVTCTINTKAEIAERIRQLRATGTEVLIGGQAVLREATAQGVPCVLIETIEETIVQTIAGARRFLEMQFKEKEQIEILNSIIDFAYDGILAIDSRGRIAVFNPVIQKLTGVSAQDAMGRDVDAVVENSRMKRVLRTGSPELGEIQRIGDQSIVTNRVPIIVEGEVTGVVATFQEVEWLQRTEVNIRKKLQAKGHTAKFSFPDIKGQGRAIRDTIEKAKLFSSVDSTVLIMGETGTGKELFAQSIHSSSARRDRPFVAVNCAAIPENLLESELFGYVEGAFTGAKKGGNAGLFEMAHTGTIFLDEISEMKANLQARLLRVLQEKEVTRIGANNVVPVDIRVIAATNRDLTAYVEEGLFRKDLYYRLCVLNLTIPPLRARKSDIPDIAQHFVDAKSRSLGIRMHPVSPSVLGMLADYDWPGNIRQLENMIERCVVLCQDGYITEGVVREALRWQPRVIPGGDPAPTQEYGGAQAEILKHVEMDTILKVLGEVDGNRSIAAKRLGISPSTLWRRLKKLEGEPDNGRNQTRNHIQS